MIKSVLFLLLFTSCLDHFTSSQVHHHGTVNNLEPNPTPTSDPQAPDPSIPTTIPRNFNCTVESLSSIKKDEVFTYLLEQNPDCVGFLWTNHPDLENIYTDENLRSVLTQTKDKKWNIVDDQEKLETVFKFIRIGMYHTFFKNINSINKENIKNLYVETFKKFRPSHFIYFKDRKKALSQWINAIDAFTDISHNFINEYQEILTFYSNNQELLIENWEDRTLLHSLFLVIQRSTTPDDLLKVINQDFLTTLNQFFKDKSFVENELPFISHNAIWALNGIFNHQDEANKSIAIGFLETALSTFDKNGPAYLWAIKTLTIRDDCHTLQSGQDICFSKIKEDIHNQVLPYSYSYNNNLIEFKTSLSNAEIDNVYTGVQESIAGFYKYIDNTSPTPIEGDPNHKSIMVIYGTLDDYTNFQPHLYDLPTNNGGIYIEKWGTLFTYERLPSESIYTLKDLSKHEYVHYLTGRYIIPGFFGETELYKNNRLTWFDEGIAELITGTEMVNGVAQIQLRSILIERITEDQDKMTISEVLSASYSQGFKFYRYSAAFFAFMQLKHPEIQNDIIQLIKSSNVTGYDQKVSELKANASLELEFKNFLKSLDDWDTSQPYVVK